MEDLLRIVSRDNQYVKLACSLRSKKGRSQSGCFLLEGLRLVEEALLAAWPLSFGLLSEEELNQPRYAAPLAHLLHKKIPVYLLPPLLFKQVADTVHSQGLLVVAKLVPEKQTLPNEADFLLIADRIADPGNLGAIMRTAWAVGAQALLLPPGSADPFSPKVTRASMGAVLRLPILDFPNEAAVKTFCKERGLTLLASSIDGECRYDQTCLDQPLAWLFGAEANGLSPFWQKVADLRVYLPMAKGAQSLNVASAAAILLYATAAQRGFA